MNNITASGGLGFNLVQYPVPSKQLWSTDIRNQLLNSARAHGAPGIVKLFGLSGAAHQKLTRH